ncbi:MAG TPA: virion core protein (lumpy skin disease virus) [Deltaproteobacteria bacterium]|nr:virion core protein (lumpy skin disease virus) [Deltaproteobacteria bacterium]
MGTNNLFFLEVIEWFDDAGMQVAHRIPESGSGEIKYGAQLIVRDSQAGVFFYNGKAHDAFGPGRHTLTTANIPLLTKILSVPWGLTSPLRAEVYFVNMKVFPNLKWGTKDPVAFKDSQLGLIRLRAFGMFNVRVTQPVLFINSLVGTDKVYPVEQLEAYLSNIIVSRLNDLFGDTLDSIVNLPGRYDEMSEELIMRLQRDFSAFGLGLTALYISSITPPSDVQKAIDDRSRLSLFDDLNKLVQMKTAMAMEKAAEARGEAGAGIGMGLGLMVPHIFSQVYQTDRPRRPSPSSASCPDCRQAIPGDARFCPYCGHQIIVMDRCPSCGKNLPAHAKFCPRCGEKAGDKAPPKPCTHCGYENLPGSGYCNQCGEKLS